MKIGFTGTSEGMTKLQKVTFRKVVIHAYEFRGRHHQFHHGDCIGSDEQAHEVADACGVTLVVHPPDNPAKRAFCKGHETKRPLPYLERNKNIVDETQFLIATPKGEEELRSGTWSTIRYARKRGRRVRIIWPDGTITTERDNP